MYFWFAIQTFHNLSVSGIGVEEPANQNMEYRKGQSNPWYDRIFSATFGIEVSGKKLYCDAPSEELGNYNLCYSPQKHKVYKE